ncbi:2-hydroxyacid dehydrogenase [Sphingobium sp. ZW T5_29]|uniref:2-hydroxyacid dehydrogenase n=1 Tax=Sphingobium sp. ZW T5_29 TaxID=3378077 RepID=UPI0038551FCD
MDVAVFSTRSYDRTFLEAANAKGGNRHDLRFFEASLSLQTVSLARRSAAVCCFVNDHLDRPVIEALCQIGVRLVVLRCAGFNNVDLKAAEAAGICVARIPAYSPEAIAEHTLALILCLNRKIHRAYVRVREGNFALDGLLGFNLATRTVGIIGTGKIGGALVKILSGLGCRIVAHDPYPDSSLASAGVEYLSLEDLFAAADIISLHCPLTPETHHMIDRAALASLRDGVMLINTSRGAVVDTRAVIEGLKSGKIGSLGLDVYEEEGDLFFRDLSGQTLQDDIFARLLTFHNVLITGHQGFFTQEAVEAIADVTIENVTAFETCGRAAYPIGPERIA